MSLKTDYKDALYDGQRRYRLIQNEDGTYSLPDETTYTQVGDKFGANELNAICEAVNQKVDDTGDASQTTATFTQAANRTNLITGEKLSILFGKIMKWFADLKAVAFSGAASDLTQDATHRFVTDMDKTKLNGIAEGANKTTVDSAMSATSTNPVQNKVINTALGGKANSSHTHSKSQITDFPASLPANGGTSAACSGNAATATKLATARAVKVGNTSKNFDGSANVTWTLAEIGAAASSHTHNYAGSSSAGGAANTAVKLATARTINGTAFDGSANITITAAANGGTSAACSGNAATATNATNHINAAGWHVAIQEAAPATGRLWAW